MSVRSRERETAPKTMNIAIVQEEGNQEPVKESSKDLRRTSHESQGQAKQRAYLAPVVVRHRHGSLCGRRIAKD